MDQITTHTEDALARLLQQYKGKERMAGLIEALFGRQTQEIEDAANQLYGRLDIDNCEGAQLDWIGSIVGQERSGYSDSVYKYLLKAKTGKNTSNGCIEDMIGVYKTLTRANRVQVLEVYPCEMDLYTDVPIDMEIATLVRHLMQGSAAGGVRVYVWSIIYSPTKAFGFDPDDSKITGFGDANDLALGGELAYCQFSPQIFYSSDNAFGFNDDNPDINGFGDATDSDAGGEMAYLVD